MSEFGFEFVELIDFFLVHYEFLRYEQSERIFFYWEIKHKPLAYKTEWQSNKNKWIIKNQLNQNLCGMWLSKTYRHYGTKDHVATATSIQRPLVQFPWLIFRDCCVLNIVWQNVRLMHQIQANWRYAPIMNYYFSDPLFRLNIKRAVVFNVHPHNRQMRWTFAGIYIFIFINLLLFL